MKKYDPEQRFSVSETTPISQENSIKKNEFLAPYYNGVVDPYDAFDYYRMVKESFEQNHCIPFSNGEVANAMFILSEMVYRTRDRFILVTGALTTEKNGVQAYNWKPFLQSLTAFLKREGVSMDVLFINPPKNEQKNHALKLLKEYPEKVNMYLAKGWMPVINDEECHFAVSDGTSYRVETGTTNAKAMACASNKEKSEKLVEIFDEFIKNKDTVTV